MKKFNILLYGNDEKNKNKKLNEFKSNNNLFIYNLEKEYEKINIFIKLKSNDIKTIIIYNIELYDKYLQYKLDIKNNNINFILFSDNIDNIINYILNNVIIFKYFKKIINNYNLIENLDKNNNLTIDNILKDSIDIYTVLEYLKDNTTDPEYLLKLSNSEYNLKKGGSNYINLLNILYGR